MNLSKTNAWLEKAENVIPMGCQTFSKSDANYPRGTTPFFVEKAQGAYFYDLDGNKYLDMVLALGPVTIGYNDERINAALKKQLQKGIISTFSFPLEAQLAEVLIDIIPSAQMVRFAKNGTDVTSAAIRVSRAYTGKDHILVCGYHGWQDWYIGITNKNKGVPQAIKELTHKFAYNDLPGLKSLIEKLEGKIAAIIMEPVQSKMPEDGYLQAVRDLATQYNIILIFDEIVSGFRIALAGGQEYFGVTPDLSLFGKGCANGMPLSFIVGKRDIMQLFEEVFFSGTFGGEALSLAAAMETITIMKSENVCHHFWQLGTLFKDGIEKTIAKCKLQDIFHVAGLAPHTVIGIKETQNIAPLEIRTLLKQEVIKHGVIMGGSHNLSLAHNKEDIDLALHAFEQALATVATAINTGAIAPFLQGGLLREGLR